MRCKTQNKQKVIRWRTKRGENAKRRSRSRVGKRPESMTGCFIRRMNHTRQRFWPPAFLLLERKHFIREEAKIGNHIGESDKIGMERRLKDDGANMDEEI